MLQGELFDLAARRLLPGWRVSLKQGVPVLRLTGTAPLLELNLQVLSIQKK